MAEVFIGSLMLVPYTFPPKGWAFCQGQLLSISQNTALFSLLGTFYGGDGRSTFGLPNLQGSVAIGQGQGPGLSNYVIGQSGGASSVTLQPAETPFPHQHSIMATIAPANQTGAANSGMGRTSSNIYSGQTSPLVDMNQAALSVVGGSQPHNNLMPYLTLNWIIALQGIFPTRS
jgi:microcystin-dependent protein